MLNISPYMIRQISLGTRSPELSQINSVLQLVLPRNQEMGKIIIIPWKGNFQRTLLFFHLQTQGFHFDRSLLVFKTTVELTRED